MALSPQQVAAKWSAGVQAGVGNYRAGIEAVQTAPSDAAINAIPRYLAGTQEAVSSGKLERGLRRVTLPMWKAAAIDKGAPRLATGARAAESDVANFFTEFLPFLATVKANLPPRGDLQMNLQRMMQNATAISEFSRTR